MIKFLYFRALWVTDFGWPDISFGIHICAAGRVDLHILKWMISIGRVPIYRIKDRRIAVSNSFHTKRTGELRAGVPNHNPNQN